MKSPTGKILVLVVVAISASAVYGHICHSIFRTPGLLAVRPEKDVTTLRTSDEFKVYAQNNYISPLHKIVLTAKSSDTNVLVNITPAAIDQLRPGERADFTVHIATKDMRARDVDVDFAIDAKELRMRPVQQPTDEELKKVLKSTYLCGKVYAAELLATRGDEEGVEFLKQVIRRDPKLTHRRSVPHHNAGRAACLVGRMGHKEMAPYLRERYKVEESPWIRGHILIGLAQLGFEEDQKTFVAAVDNPDNFVRACALLALAMRDDPEAPKRLKASLNAPELPMQIIAAWGQGIDGNPEAIKKLESIVDKAGGDMNSTRGMGNTTPDLPGDSQTTGGGWGNYIPRAMAGEALLYLAGRNL